MREKLLCLLQKIVLTDKRNNSPPFPSSLLWLLTCEDSHLVIGMEKQGGHTEKWYVGTIKRAWVL